MMNRKLLSLAGFTLLAIAIAVAAETTPPKFKPKDGFVPDAKTAIKIAVAVGVWTVEGSLPADRLGGVALAEIAKDDGRVLRVSHGQ